MPAKAPTKNPDKTTTVVRQHNPDAKKPKMYRVLLHNDDYTPFNLVTEILTKVFNKSSDQAWEIMMAAHNTGQALCGVYTFEIAETKVEQGRQIGHQADFPLEFTFEKVD